MHLPAFSFSLLIVLITGFNFAQADEDESTKKLKALLCAEDLKEIRFALLECVYLVDWSEYLSIVRPCNEVFKSKDIEEVRQSLCQASYEELEKMDDCVSRRIHFSGKKQEMAEKAKPVKECSKDVLAGEI